MNATPDTRPTPVPDVDATRLPYDRAQDRTIRAALVLSIVASLAWCASAVLAVRDALDNRTVHHAETPAVVTCPPPPACPTCPPCAAVAACPTCPPAPRCAR